VTHLRKMMLEEFQRRNYCNETIRHYLRYVELFARHFGRSPDKLGPDHLRRYQAYLLKERKLDPGSVENHVSALRFFFVRTLRRHEFREFIPFPKTRNKLPNILSREEVTQLIEASHGLFQRTLLMVLYGTGMRRAEIAQLKIGDASEPQAAESPQMCMRMCVASSNTFDSSLSALRTDPTARVSRASSFVIGASTPISRKAESISLARMSSSRMSLPSRSASPASLLNAGPS
jgi:hypothetical protein